MKRLLPVLAIALSFSRVLEAQAAPSLQDLPARWNELAYDIAFAEDSFRTFKGHRALAMMHIAMHDAMNTARPKFRLYVQAPPRTDADPMVAGAQAAYGVLHQEYPGAESRIQRELTAWMTQVSDGPAKTTGTVVGLGAAAMILARRQGDGWDTPGSYQFRTGPGAYQTFEPWNGFTVQPGFRRARPFALASPDQHRPPTPPLLTSTAYRDALTEVKAQGSKESRARTADQTGYAVWWMEFAEGSVNRLARELVRERKPDAWDAARMFAWMNMALFDSYVSVWDGKYEYNHWRPYTAIRLAESDGNRETTGDTTWNSMFPAPPFPEYPSAHAAGCQAAFSVLGSIWGDSVAFTMKTITAPEGMPARRFTSFSAAARECADSRVQLGWHFRYATDAGLVLGRQVATHVMAEQLGAP